MLQLEGRLLISAHHAGYAGLFGGDEMGYAGDIRVTKEWARILKISEWFTWIGFEDMPESYFTDI